MNTERAQQYADLYREFLVAQEPEWHATYTRTVAAWTALTEQEKLIVTEILNANEG